MVQMLTSPLPPPFLLVYSLRVPDFGMKPFGLCKGLDETLCILQRASPFCLVRRFSVLMSLASMSSFGLAIIPAGYRMTGTAYVLIALTLLLLELAVQPTLLDLA